MNNTPSNNFLETERLGTLMRKYAVPCIIALLVGALYNIVDQIFIANASYLGSYGNAANTAVFPLTVVALAIATMFGDGCCAFVSLSLGAREQANAHRSIGTTIIAVTVTGIAITVIYFVFQKPILIMFGAQVNETTFSMSKEYFFWITAGIPFYMFGQALNPIIRSDGSPQFAMVSLLAGAIINTVFDPLFIYVFHWGMAGAAIATVLGQIASAVLSIIYLFKMKNIALSRDSFIFRFRLLKKSIPLGITSFLTQISVVISMAAVINAVVAYSAKDAVFGLAEYAQIPTAVIGIVMKCFQIIISVSIGLAAGCIPIVAFNTGAGHKERVRNLLTLLIVSEAVIGFIALLFFELFPHQITAVFGATHESPYYAAFSVKCIRIFLSMLVFSCVNKGVTIFLQSLGKPKESALLSTVREIIFGVGLPLLLPVFWGLDGILFFMPMADGITFIISAVILRSVYRQLSDKQAVVEQRESVPEHTAEIVSKQTARTTAVKQDAASEPIIITIGRSYGAGGRSIGKLVAEKLSIAYYDTELLNKAACIRKS